MSVPSNLVADFHGMEPRHSSTCRMPKSPNRPKSSSHEAQISHETKSFAPHFPGRVRPARGGDRGRLRASGRRCPRAASAWPTTSSKNTKTVWRRSSPARRNYSPEAKTALAAYRTADDLTARHAAYQQLVTSFRQTMSQTIDATNPLDRKFMDDTAGAINRREIAEKPYEEEFTAYQAYLEELARPSPACFPQPHGPISSCPENLNET